MPLDNEGVLGRQAEGAAAAAGKLARTDLRRAAGSLPDSPPAALRISVERGRQTAAVLRRHRMLVSQFVEERDHEPPDLVAPLCVRAVELAEQELERALPVVRLERGYDDAVPAL